MGLLNVSCALQSVDRTIFIPRTLLRYLFAIRTPRYQLVANPLTVTDGKQQPITLHSVPTVRVTSFNATNGGLRWALLQGLVGGSKFGDELLELLQQRGLGGGLYVWPLDLHCFAPCTTVVQTDTYLHRENLAGRHI